MRQISKEKTQLNIISMEEEWVNTIAFIFGILAAIGAFIVVVGFLDGTKRDYSVLMLVIAAFIMRFFEKK